MTTQNDIAEFEKIAADTLSKLSSYLHEVNQVGSPASGYAPMREILQKLNIAFRGEQALGVFVDERYAMAKVFHGLLSQRENFYVPYEPETNILCFRYQGVDGKTSDNLQQKIRFEMMKRKEFHITSTLINSVRYLRVTIMNKLTDENVLSSLLDKIEKLAKEFS